MVSTISIVLAQNNNYSNSELSFEKQEILDPGLAYAPSSHDFGDVYEGAILNTVFNVWNSGCCQLVFQISESYNWISVNPSDGFSLTSSVPITVTIDTEGLAVGYYRCDILIISNAGTGVFEVNVKVIKASTPILFVYPSSIDFGEVIMRSTAEKSFEIWNVGIDTLTYNLSEDCEWLGINPSGGSSIGEHDRITISINTTNLDYGHYSYDITIESNGGKEVLRVLLNVTRAKYPVLAFRPTFYDFGEVLKGDSAQTFFEVWNAGGRELHFYLIENYEWVTITPSEEYSYGQHVVITVIINTSKVPSGHYNGIITIDSNGGGIDSFNFAVTIIDAINTPPSTPEVNGLKSVTQGKTSEYSCVSTDLNFDRIYYNFSWGDGSSTSWLGPFISGERCSASHVWVEKGVFEIKVQAKDSNTSHTKSNWSEPYRICIGCYLNISVDEAWKLVQNISDGIQIPIDIRPLEVFYTEHIHTQSNLETTRWFDEKLFMKRVPLTLFNVVYKGEEVILYSQNGVDSARIAEVLVDHKFSGTVYNMVGGIDAWINAGYPTIGN